MTEPVHEHEKPMPAWARLLRDGRGPHEGRQSFVIETVLDGEPCKVRVLRWEVFQRWRRRVTVAFVLLTFVSTLAAYLADRSRRTSTNAVAVESRRAVERSCVDRADVRVTVAVGFDELRRFALTPPAPGDKDMAAAVAAFLDRTQPPIDRLLSEASGGPIKTKGELQFAQVAKVRDLAARRCAVSAQRFQDVVSGASG